MAHFDIYGVRSGPFRSVPYRFGRANERISDKHGPFRSVPARFGPFRSYKLAINDM